MEEHVRNQLKYFRESASCTQEDVADAAGITTKAYNRYEYGIREPKVRIANRIARFLDTTTEQIWGCE